MDNRTQITVCSLYEVTLLVSVSWVTVSSIAVTKQKDMESPEVVSAGYLSFWFGLQRQFRQ